VQDERRAPGQSLQAKRRLRVPPDRDEWFVFVKLHGAGERPDFYVMPRNVVAAYIFIGYELYRRSGKAKPTSTRVVEASVAAPYEERWDLLKSPEKDAPCVLPAAIFDQVASIGLPPGHPGLTPPAAGAPLPHPPKWLQDSLGLR
jgi:hypothetical protein